MAISIKASQDGTKGSFQVNGVDVFSFDQNGPIGVGITANSTDTLTNKTISYADNTLQGVQPSLVSGTNIKTVNGTSVLGTGDIAVQPTLVSGTNIKTVNGTSVLGTGDISITGGATLSDDVTTDITYYPTLATTTSGVMTTTKVSSSKLTFNPASGELFASVFQSSSDANLKENVVDADGSLVDQLRGVEFTWKSNGKKSSGVIAQELEEVLPHLVENGVEGKNVNYAGLTAYLIEAVKDLKGTIDELKTEINKLKGNS